MPAVCRRCVDHVEIPSTDVRPRPHTQPNGSVRFRTAATAIAAGWRVATANVRHFEHVPGLDVVDIKLT